MWNSDIWGVYPKNTSTIGQNGKLPAKIGIWNSAAPSSHGSALDSSPLLGMIIK